MSTTSILKKRGPPTSTAPVVENRVGFKIPTADNIDVQAAFAEANKSNVMDSNYRQLINVLKSPDTDDEALVRLLKRIKNSAPQIERHNDEVLDCVLKINLLKRSVHVIDAFSQLACDMVFIHPAFLRSIVVALLGTFMSPEATSKDVPEREEKLERLHALFRLLFKLVPTAPTRFIEILAEVFPYMKRDGIQQASLVGHLLRMTSYIPDHRLELLQLITHKALQIDLHCPKDEISGAELEDEDDAMEGDDIFEMEKVSGTDSERMQHPLADILDQVLNQFYLHFQKHCNVKDGGDMSKLDWEKTKVLFKDFLTIFDKIVLPTHKCCHVQFLLFYLCSFRPAALGVAFLDYLWKKVQNPATSCIVRQASAFYIGSFLARAKYVPISTVCDSLSLMCQWAHGYVASLNDSGFCQPQHDIQRHGTFYAVCQTVFYVFAFHHKAIADGAKGLQYLRELNLEALVMCPLNPLKACLPAVVKQFASIARHYQLVYCYSVIERNQRLALPTAGGDTLYGDVVLDAFFPFDPYVLKRTGKWIEPLYRKFEKSDDDDDDDADLDDEPEDDEDELMCKSPKSPSYVTEMFSYGASPGFKRSLSFNHHR
uniref:Putative rna polymerase i specific transcription initiation factor rrn3 n=1 Tax=Hyalomma excavatum TaxID=257692 RepID=A0A131XCX7_9ACAR